MKRLYTALLAGSMMLIPAGCSDYLDVNDNPNAPETVAPTLDLPPMIHWMVTSPQFDGRFVGRYTQEWNLPSATSTPNTWDRMGYDPSSDNGAQQWRDVYWSLGQNLVDMMNLSRQAERWDLLGVGQILKAWGWLVLTDLHGEIVVKEAIDPNRFAFDYDSQEFTYQEVLSLLDSATTNLQRTDGNISATYIARGDKMYSGDRTKWLKFAYGLKAIALNHFSNKSTYKPNDVIALVDKSFTSNADDAIIAYPATNNDDTNFWGRTRNNITNYRQTNFVLGLMNGTQLGTPDPRMTRMLSPSPDGQYRGMDINATSGGYTTADSLRVPNNFFGYRGTAGLGLPSRYIFDDRSKLPNMTYAELQFVKAEAAFRAGDKVTALAAYKNGISAHIDFVNQRNLDNAQAVSQITAAEKAAFLADPAIVPSSASALTITQIMVQKYIALWGWGHNEIWMDMRRFHYTDLDPATGKQVYPGFAIPTNLYPDNAGKIVWRIRPRFNSEYVWNREALDVIGGLATDYHTKPLWIFFP